MPHTFKSHLYLIYVCFVRLKNTTYWFVPSSSVIITNVSAGLSEKRNIKLFFSVNGELEVLRPWLLGGFPPPPKKDIVLLFPCPAEGPPLLPLAAEHHFCCHPW